MALVIQEIFSLAIIAPITPPENAPSASPNTVVSQVKREADSTRLATASGVAGSINSGGVGLIALAIMPTINKIIEAITAPRITDMIFLIKVIF
jgi:hypothetical protein